MGIQVPERAQMIRAILLEVERLHSHLLNLGLSTPTTACSTSIAAWKNWRKPVWVTTK